MITSKGALAKLLAFLLSTNFCSEQEEKANAITTSSSEYNFMDGIENLNFKQYSIERNNLLTLVLLYFALYEESSTAINISL